jgi:hypothetical protein
VWRRPGDGRFGFDKTRYGVQEIDEAPAKDFVTTLHYSGSFPAARYSHGMFDLAGDTSRLVGVAVLSVPVNKKVLTCVFPALVPFEESLELGRLVLLDEVPHDAETWFGGEIRRLAAKAGLRGLVMFSDPIRRTRVDGTVVLPGHVGTIYQAGGARYAGRATRRTLKLLPDGTVFSDRAAQKIRRQEQGHRYAEERLIAWGARPPRAGERPPVWLARALDDAGVRRLPHPGNHRYAWPLGRTRRERALVLIKPQPQPYPKRDADPGRLPARARSAA